MHFVTYVEGRSPRLVVVWRDTALDCRFRVNGETRPEASTAQMTLRGRGAPRRPVGGETLEPGDILVTGTPSGVGAASGRYLEPGDIVEAEIDGLGTLRNPVVARGAA